jgi:hypothetical protein
LGYWQLINAVDKFVICDNIKYTKKGWINRNRFLLNNKDEYFTIPLKKDSDFLDIKDRYIAETFNKNKMIARFKEAYYKASEYKKVMPLIEECILYKNNNLFEYIYHSIQNICKYLNISTQLLVSSKIDIDHNLKGKYKVIEICKKMNAQTYINAIGGKELYDKSEFLEKGINLHFIDTHITQYKQLKNDFVSGLSIIDIMMFNSIENINLMLDNYELV